MGLVQKKDLILMDMVVETVLVRLVAHLTSSTGPLALVSTIPTSN